MPSGLSDRAEDVLEPLFILADVAGGNWPTIARTAAVELMGHKARTEQAVDQSIGLELLEDIKAVFISRNMPTKIRTADLVEGLLAIEGSPWATVEGKGERLTPHRLARLLKGFNIRPPAKIRLGDDTFRGYYYAAFEDAFTRYLPSEVEQVEHANVSGPEPAILEVEHGGSVPHSNNEKTSINPASVPHVPLSRSESEENRDRGGVGHDRY
jgi:hypothetical protein